MDPAKKNKPKPKRATNENHGKACPKAAALKHSLECVSGKTYSTAFAASGNRLKEKNVPARKVIGTITRLLKVLISECEFITKAISTPNKENTQQETTRTNRKRGLIINTGERTKPTAIMATELISPRTTPINALPITMEYKLIGDIRHSSKLLKKIRSTLSFEPAPLKLVDIAVKAIIPGITNSR